MYPVSVMDKLLSLQETGKRLVDAGELYEAFDSIFGAQSGIAGGAATPGPMLTSAINEVVSGAFVQLPSAIAGLQVTIVNNGVALTVVATTVNPANGGTADLIGGVATAAQAAGVTAQYLCYSLGNWVVV